MKKKEDLTEKEFNKDAIELQEKIANNKWWYYGAIGVVAIAVLVLIIILITTGLI